MSNVIINGLTSVHAGSGGTLVTVDVCKTPPFCVPIPYPNIAKSSDAANTATSVKINGNPACNATSTFAISTGDEAGACGGVISGTIKGMAEFLTFSANVFIEGVPAVRQGDLMVSNNKNTPPAPLIQAPAGLSPPVIDGGPTELEAAELDNKVDWSVAGGDIKNMKSMIGIANMSKSK